MTNRVIPPNFFEKSSPPSGETTQTGAMTVPLECAGGFFGARLAAQHWPSSRQLLTAPSPATHHESRQRGIRSAVPIAQKPPTSHSRPPADRKKCPPIVNRHPPTIDTRPRGIEVRQPATNTRPPAVVTAPPSVVTELLGFVTAPPIVDCCRPVIVTPATPLLFTAAAAPHAFSHRKKVYCSNFVGRYNVNTTPLGARATQAAIRD